MQIRDYIKVIVFVLFIVTLSFLHKNEQELGATLEQRELSKLSDTQIEQYLVSGKYSQVKPYIKDGVTYEVHEYQAPDGKGFQVLMKKTLNGVLYRKSIGYGVESVSRTYDWIPLNENLASTTPK